jgi:hypothetical protein
MTSVRTTQKSFLLFRFFTIPFLLLLVTALALDGLLAYAEPSIGPVLSHEKSTPVPAAALGGFQNCDIIATVDQHQIYNFGDFWHSLRPSGEQPTLQLTIQRKNAQSTISHQNPSLPNAVT